MILMRERPVCPKDVPVLMVRAALRDGSYVDDPALAHPDAMHWIAKVKRRGAPWWWITRGRWV